MSRIARIILSKCGEELIPRGEDPNASITENTGFFPTFCGDESFNKGMVGFHAFCKGVMRLRAVSDSHNVLCCSDCNFRALVPKRIDSYSELRRHFVSEIEAKARRAKEAEDLAVAHSVYGPKHGS